MRISARIKAKYLAGLKAPALARVGFLPLKSDDILTVLRNFSTGNYGLLQIGNMTRARNVSTAFEK